MTTITIATLETRLRAIIGSVNAGERSLKITSGCKEQMNLISDIITTSSKLDMDKITAEDLEVADAFITVFTKDVFNGNVINNEVAGESEEDFAQLIADMRSKADRFEGEMGEALAVILVNRIFQEFDEISLSILKIEALGDSARLRAQAKEQANLAREKAQATCEDRLEVTDHSKADADALIVELIKAGHSYIDDHNQGEAKAQVCGVLKIGDAHHAFIGFSTQLFCINPIYLGNDGKIHVSRSSVSGLVRMDRTPNNPAAAMAAFNESYRGNHVILEMNCTH